MGGAASVNKAAQARLKANLDAQVVAEKEALQKYVDTASEYAKSKGTTLPSNFLEFAKISNMGFDATLVGNYYAPNKFDSKGNPFKGGERGGAGKTAADILQEQAGKIRLVTDPKFAVDKFLSDPGKYYSQAISESVFKQNVDAAKAYIKEAQNPAYKIPVSTLQNAINTGIDRYRQVQEIAAGNPFMNALVSVGLAYALPGIGTFLATELGVSAAVGTALASTAVQVAQGASFEDALKNATVNAIVNTGSNSVATEINNVIKNPAVTNAVVSAGASAVKTAAAGGSAEDIAKNIGGAIAGSATTSATGSNLVGSTVGGAVSGGVGGALSGAASALGQDAAKPKDTTTPATTTSETTLDPATQQLVTAIQQEQTSPSSSTELGQVAAITSDVPGYVTDAGTLDMTAGGITPGGVAPNVNVTATQGGTPTLTDTKQDVLETITTPKTTDTTAATGGYTPTITTTPSNVISTGGTSTAGVTDKDILNLISGTGAVTGASTGATTGTGISAGTGTGTGTTVDTTGTTGTTAGTGTGASTGATTGATTNTGAVTGATTGTGTGTGLTDTTTTGTTTTTDAGTNTDKAIFDLISGTTKGGGPTTDAGTGSTAVDTGAGVVTTPVTDTTGTGTEATTGLPDTTGTTTTTVGTDTGAGAGTGTGTDKAILDLISTDKTTGTGTATDTGTGTTAVDTGTSTDASTGAITDAATDTTDTTDTATEDTTTKPEDKYKPNLRIYGGTTPSTLSQSLGTGGTYSTGVATTGLTGSRGAGEIESKETGKKRKNVWNEASLRLKDALGV
jgi:hypothetical protein